MGISQLKRFLEAQAFRGALKSSLPSEIDSLYIDFPQFIHNAYGKVFPDPVLYPEDSKIRKRNH